mgnify:CR=1 FL=1
MDDLDDVIGLLNSNRNQKTNNASEQLSVIQILNTAENEPAELKEIADRKLNIEIMMEELEAMQKKKQ